MSKHPQVPRLAIVNSTNKKLRQESVGTQWWGPRRPLAARKIQGPSQSIRMAVMPTLSRNLWFAGMAWISQFVRGYFVPGTAGQRGVVLSFRRHAAEVKKKSSGSVGWPSNQEVAPQEGGGR